MKNLTLKQYLALHGIKYKDIKTVSVQTIVNIIKGGHDGLKYNSRYKWLNSYYPSEDTIIKLSKWLDIDIKEVKKLINNQLKSLQESKK